MAEGRVRGTSRQQLPLTPAPSPSVGRGENGDPLNTYGLRTRRAKFARSAAAVVAVGLALAAFAVSARAEATRFDDIAVTPLPVPSCESMHGYIDYRFAVENRSATQPHQVTINLPYASYREDTSLSDLSRSVVVAPGSTVTVSLLQCALTMQGSNAAVSVDGRRQREFVRLNIESHGLGRYMSRPHGTTHVILTSRGVPFPTPGEKDPISLARAEQDVREWNTEWLAYSRYDGVVVAGDEMERMPPPVRLALLRYVECGGTLHVVGDSWKPPQDWRPMEISNGPLRGYTSGFGVCLIGVRPGTGDAAHTQFIGAAGDSAAPFRNIRTVEGANREFPVVEDIRVPVRGMLVLMLAFVVVIGPVNLILLGRLHKRIWLLVTVPLISLATGALMFGYSIVSEGFEGHCKTATLTLLDETTGRATSLGWAAYYSPLATREGLHFSYQTELTPQVAQNFSSMYGGTAAPSTGRTVDWTQDQHLARGWLAARVPVHFAVRKSEVRRERLAVRTGVGGCVSVVNGLGVPIKKLTLSDREGRLHSAENIPAGAEVTLATGDAKPPTCGLRNLFRAAWLPSIRTLADSPQQYLRPLTYVAVLDGSPFTDNAMPSAREDSSLAVVYGILGSRADGN